MKQIPGWLKLVLKVGISGLCLWYVAGKIDWPQSFQLLRQANPIWLVAAFILFMLSKLVSAIRLQLYFDNISLNLLYKKSIALYWLGMFYNLFLPGGIGGDAYKVLLLRKTHPHISPKLTTSAVLLDRVSGVAGLGILAGIAFYFLFKPSAIAWGVLVLVTLGVIAFYQIVRRWFSNFLQSFESTLLLGIIVQLLQVGCMACIMQSLHIYHHFLAFQLLFLVSSIVAIFPFTIGGLGAREMVFLWGAQQFGLQQHEAVLVSLLFYLITVLGSLPGIIWIFKDPLPAPFLTETK